MTDLKALFDNTPTFAEIACSRIKQACDEAGDGKKKKIIKSISIHEQINNSKLRNP